MQRVSLGWVDPLTLTPKAWEVSVLRLWLVPPQEGRLRKAKLEKDRETENTSGGPSARATSLQGRSEGTQGGAGPR